MAQRSSQKGPGECMLERCEQLSKKAEELFQLAFLACNYLKGMEDDTNGYTFEERFEDIMGLSSSNGATALLGETY